MNTAEPLSGQIRAVAAQLTHAADAIAQGRTPSIDLDQVERVLQGALETVLAERRAEVVRAFARRAARTAADLSAIEKGVSAASDAAQIADSLSALANSCAALKLLVYPGGRLRDAA